MPVIQYNALNVAKYLQIKLDIVDPMITDLFCGVEGVTPAKVSVPLLLDRWNFSI